MGVNLLAFGQTCQWANLPFVKRQRTLSPPPDEHLTTSKYACTQSILEATLGGTAWTNTLFQHDGANHGSKSGNHNHPD